MGSDTGVKAQMDMPKRRAKRWPRYRRNEARGNPGRSRRMGGGSAQQDTALARNRHHPVLAGGLDVDDLVIGIVFIVESIPGLVDLLLAGGQRGLEIGQ